MRDALLLLLVNALFLAAGATRAAGTDAEVAEELGRVLVRYLGLEGRRRGPGRRAARKRA